MNNWLNLEGEVCAVTGALGGMGVEICREFARNGANVVLLDLDEEKVRTAAAGLSDEFGIHAEGYRMDATNEEEVQAAVDATIRDFGRVDALVNTAGILRFSPMEDLPLSDWEAVIKVNLTGTFIASQRFGREIDQAGGRSPRAHLDRCLLPARDLLRRLQLHEGRRQHDVQDDGRRVGPLRRALQLRVPLLRQDPDERQLLLRPRGRAQPQPPYRHASHRRGHRHRQRRHVPGVHAFRLHHRRRDRWSTEASPT